MLFSSSKWVKKIALGAVLAGLIACQSLDISQKRIFHPQTNRYLTLSEFVQEVQNTPMILLGEKHDNSIHHQAEIALFQQLYQTGKLRSVALEMLPTSQQVDINQALERLRQTPNVSNSTVKQILPWTEKWDWSQYGDLITALSNSKVQVLGGNLDRCEIDTLFRGAYPLNGNRSTQPAIKQRIAKTIAQNHQIDPNDQTIQTMVTIQQFKDRRMAEALIKGNKSTLLIAGNFHVNKAVGVPVHLADLGKNQFVVISLVKQLDDINLKESDYIWLLP